MLDLASEMLAGATMEDVSTVLYFKVLQWAGYSRNLKVAAFERMVEKDGRTRNCTSASRNALPGATWARVQNNPLAIDGLIPKIAHEMYPALFPEAKSFSSSTEGFFQFEDQRVQEMIDIVREKSGKQNIIFIIDEVGQYIASRDNLILNLDGLAKNLKRLGDGKVWIIATAQQTLTEDDPRAALNSDKLYKLKDRFPIQIDLESSDIKEICYRRLLGKSPAGEAELGKLFDAHGQALRHNTKLQDAKYYDADFSRESFTNLYPFLPAHFDILLHLLGCPGQVDWRHRPALGDQGDSGRPQGRRRLEGDGGPAGGLAGHDGHAVRRAGKGHSPRVPLHPPGGRQSADSLPRLAAPSGHRQVGRGAADPRQLAGNRAKRRPA